MLSLNIKDIQELQKNIVYEESYKNPEFINSVNEALEILIDLKQRQNKYVTKYRKNNGLLKTREYNKKRYYLINNIYHPTLNPQGTVEKRHKRSNL